VYIITALVCLLGILVILPPDEISEGHSVYVPGKNYTALAIGVTGATGTELLKELVHAEHVTKVTAITRSKLNWEHPKLETIIIENFDTLLQDDLKELEGREFDAAFLALGTTRKQAGSDEAFTKIDLEYAIAFARHALKCGAKHFAHLTSMGADANSFLLYPRVKGLSENAIDAFDFKSISIFRPALLITPPRKDSRPMEKILQIVFPYVNKLLRGPLAKYASIHVADVAKAMRVEYEIRVLNEEQVHPRTVIYESDEIQRMANKHRSKK
jgi:hypothetical protein